MTAFRANGHVVINDHEGEVIRLTSKATVLMTLDGNHLGLISSPDEQVAAVEKVDATQATRLKPIYSTATSPLNSRQCRDRPIGRAQLATPGLIRVH